MPGFVPDASGFLACGDAPLRTRIPEPQDERRRSAQSLGAAAYIGDMSEIPPAEASGEGAAAKLDAEAEGEASIDAKIDAEAEAEANLEPEAEGEL